MTSAGTTSIPTSIPSVAVSNLETSLNKIFLAVGDFLEFNSRTATLGLDNISRKPQDEARRALESNLQTFHSSCDALETQIIRAKQVLRREIDLLKNPPKEPEAEKEDEVMETTEPQGQEEMVEEVNGMVNGDGNEEEAKVEESEPIKEEDEMSDEDGLFSSEFDSLMDPNGFQTDMGFGDSMDWMNNV